MSEDKRNDAASGKDAASKEKSQAAAPKSEQASAASAAKSASNQGASAAPKTDKPAKSGSSGTGKSETSKASARDQSKNQRKNQSSRAGASKNTKAAPGRDANQASGTASQQASTPKRSDTTTTPTNQTAARASGGSGGPSRPATGSAGSGGDGGGSAKLIAAVAVVLALIAIVIAGWLLYRGQGQLDAVDARLDTVEQSVQSNVQDVVMPRVKRLDSRVESLDKTVQKRAQTLSSLQQSLEQAQARTADLADRLTGNKSRWELNEIESLLQAANQRLQLYDDADGARHALSLASDAIARKGDPRLHKLRGEIVNEIAALDALPDPDVEGLSLALGAMIDQVPDLPLASSVPGEYRNSSDDGDGSASADDGDGYSVDDFKAQFSQGWDHFVDSVGRALSGMLTIRRSDGTQRALLPPDQAFFLSQNLQLELRSARLALLERDTQNYRDSLASARKWLDDYYNTDAAPVSKMRERLGQMSNVKLDWDAPDISKSLTMLRDMMSRHTRSGATDKSTNEQAQDSAGSGAADEGTQTGEGDQ